MLTLAVGESVALRLPACAGWRIAFPPAGLRCDGRRDGALLFTAVYPAQHVLELVGDCAAVRRLHYRVR